MIPVAGAAYLHWQAIAAWHSGALVVPAFLVGGLLFWFLPRALMFIPRGVLLTREYFSIDGTKVHNGKPRCIWCGHVGVYTHGAYADATKYHDCSGCGRTMYIS